MQLPPLRDLHLRTSQSSANGTDQFHHLRLRLGSTVSEVGERRLADRSWKDNFGAMVEASLHEAEDNMLSLPYTQIRQQFGRFSRALESVPARNLIRTDPNSSVSPLVDIDLRNIMATQHHGSASVPRSGYVNGVSEESSSRHPESQRGDPRFSRAENSKRTL